MASCTTALSATSKRSGCAPLFCSEVHGDGSHGWSMPRVFGLRPQSADHTYGGSVVQIVSKGRWVPNLVPVTPIFKINSTIGDPSSPFLVRTAPRVKVEQQTTIPQQERLRNAIARRSDQREEMVNNLKRYGLAGILSYGLLNTVYYLGTFLFVSFYVSPSPGGLGFGPAAERFLKIFAAVWAGSQVTKLLRAAGALSLAPFVDRGLNWYTQYFKFKSRATAFNFLVAGCFGLAALVFLIVTTLWS